MLNQCVTTVFPTGKSPPKKTKPASTGTDTGLHIASKITVPIPYQKSGQLAIINERQAWHAVRFFNCSPGLSREARRVGIAMVILARAVRSGDVDGEQIRVEASLTTGKMVAGLHALATAGLIRRELTGGLSLNWESLQ